MNAAVFHGNFQQAARCEIRKWEVNREGGLQWGNEQGGAGTTMGK